MNRIKLILIVFVLIASTSIASAGTNNVGGDITTDETWTLAGSPYNVTRSVTVLNDATLTIDPGVTVNFKKGRYLWIGGVIKSGKLVADGTSEKKIIFTGTDKTAGHWRGIVFSPTSDDTSVINNAIIEYGGRKCWCNDSHRFANLILCFAAPTINGSTIQNSNGDGILCIGRSWNVTTSGWQDPTITCNLITNNINGVHTLLSANPTIKNNNICGNSMYGVCNDALSVWANATNNWWGNASGPSGVGPGTGDAVSDKVDYSGWTGSPVPCAPIPELSSVILVAAGLLMLAGYVRIGRRD